MKREIKNLQQKVFDLLIIGGGIYGACIAWDASQRGLSTAIIDKGDFGHATSANSLKIIHGGLRYLQDGNLALARTMIRERRAFLKIAPHLVHPLPCVLPTSRHLSRSKPLLAAALSVNNFLGYDRNKDQPDPQKQLPAGRIISREEFLHKIPVAANKNITGGAMWHDAQVFNSERLTLSFILSAVQNGAMAANYLEAVGFLKEGQQIMGVRARDVLSGDGIDIRASVVVNTTGPFSKELLTGINSNKRQANYRPSLALNLVTRQVLPDCAVGIPSHSTLVDENGDITENRQTLFIAPWRDYSLIGTKHLALNSSNGQVNVSKQVVSDFLGDINKALPTVKLKPEDVYLIHQGYLPDESQNGSSAVKLVRNSEIVDHSKSGMEGLITVIGVKYTLARHAAERAVDLVLIKLGQSSVPCRTATTPLHGGDIEQLENLIDSEANKQGDRLDRQTIRHLVFNYGTAYGDVIKQLDQYEEWGEPLGYDTQVIKAEVLHGVRNEMAMRLGDIVLRRTDLGSAGKPADASIQECARIMATELGWNRDRVDREIEELDAFFASRTLT